MISSRARISTGPFFYQGSYGVSMLFNRDTEVYVTLAYRNKREQGLTSRLTVECNRCKATALKETYPDF